MSQNDTGRVFVITDCGSTTTKAILIEQIDGVYRQTYRSEAATTVEAPVADVTVGVRRALLDLSAVSGRRLIDESGDIIRPVSGSDGCDMYMTTSSAGGGLQMVVLGLVKTISAASAEKAALGAGAIVTDCIACDDTRSMLEQVERLRRQRPDMVLLAGGTDGGQQVGVVELAELLALAEPVPRFGERYELPVVYAGNSDAAAAVSKVLSHTARVIVEKNVRPLVETETISHARDRIHTLFLEHVMQQAPGFGALMDLCDADVVPTPAAVGKMLQLLGEKKSVDALCADIGGATTDVFSFVNGKFNRTVSANLGMSYSAAFVLKESGIANILRWLPKGGDEDTLLNQLMNKTIRPTTIPETLEELAVEQALAREALRLSLAHHATFATGLKGTVGERNIDGGFSTGPKSDFQIRDVDLIVGSGGVLSHAPLQMQTVAMLVDAFLPEGVTAIAKDSIFMMPHLGILGDIDDTAALEVFFNDCIVPLATCVAPLGKAIPGRRAFSWRFDGADGTVSSGTVIFGELIHEPLKGDGRLTLAPQRHVDVGFGAGCNGTLQIDDTLLGLILDGRGRPLASMGTGEWQRIYEECQNG
ncbi:MAG: glutamate mutase L [Deltaproteobacteria bacterium]|nr:glutamate mutase L [Deltaproteobacteria bacterium]